MKATKSLFIISLFILFAVTTVFSDSAAQEAQDKKKYEAILGEWEIEADAGGTIMNFTITFSMEKDKIVGLFTSADFGESKIGSIKLDKKTLTFDLLEVQGIGDVPTSAEVGKDTMEGTFMSSQGDAPFTATRKKDKK